MLKNRKDDGFNIINFIMLTVAGIINAMGATIFLAPVRLYDSGFSGTAMLLWQVTPPYMTLWMFLLILNIPMFIYGLKKQGIVFTVYSLYAVAIYSAAAYIITDILPIDVSSDKSPLAGQEIILCAVFGGLLSGVGSGITMRFGGAIDGIDVLAVIFAKKVGMTVGTFIMIYNVLLYTISGAVTESWVLPLYSVIAYFVALKVIDLIVEGLDRAKAAMIITDNIDDVGKALSDEFGIGMTVIDAHGFYSNEPKYMIYFVVNRFQIGKMRKIVHKYDRHAFISITEVSDLFARNQ